MHPLARARAASVVLALVAGGAACATGRSGGDAASGALPAFKRQVSAFEVTPADGWPYDFPFLRRIQCSPTLSSSTWTPTATSTYSSRKRQES